MEYKKEGYWKEYKRGFYIGKGVTAETAFSKEQQDDLYRLEDESWWFQYRAAVIINLLDCFFEKDKQILDVGGGNGYTTFRVMEAGYETGLIEPSMEACRHALQRGIPQICCGIIDEYSIEDSSIEQMLLLDVLEHIQDDGKFLHTIHQKMVPGGYLLITVPAFMCLWSSEDEAAGHFRRYTIRQLREVTEKAGFEEVYGSYFMQFLFLPILAVRVGLEHLGLLKRHEERTKKENEKINNWQFKSKSGMVAMVLRFSQSIELWKLEKRKNMKFGSSIVLVLKKRSSK